MDHLYQLPPCEIQRTSQKGKCKEWKKSHESLSSRREETVACISTLQFWLLAQDLHKMSPVKIPTWMLAEWRYSEEPYLAEKITTIDSY